MRTEVILLGALIGVCSSISIGAGATIEKQMGPQSFAEKSIERGAEGDSLILRAVDAALVVARRNQFYYDASEAYEGRVIVKALWKGDPIILTMRFFMKDAAISLGTSLQQSARNFMKKNGQKVEAFYYSQLLEETRQQGLKIFSDPEAKP
jgi:hypothetical protein